MKSFALSRLPGPGHEYTTEVDLWCTWGGDRSEAHWYHKEPKPKKKREPGRMFFVINGYWYGRYDKKTETLTIEDRQYDSLLRFSGRNPAEHKTSWPAKIVWEGDAPFSEGQYNEAMQWIREQIGAPLRD